MDIDKAYRVLKRVGEPMMVMAYAKQHWEREFMQVSVAPAEDLEGVSDERYADIIGVYNASGISYEDFYEDCKAICQRNRAIETNAKSILYALGEGEGEDRIPSDEPNSPVMDDWQRGASHTFPRHSREVRSSGGSDREAASNPEGRNSAKLRDLHGQETTDSDEQGESPNRGRWGGYL